MKDITYIAPSKNDNYDIQNLDKLILSINTNVEQLFNLNLEIETILLDWGSDVPFHTLDRIKNEIKIPINHVYVDKSVLFADGLNPNRYYEYFAKNIGIRQATGKYVLIENSDIINDEVLAKSIAEMIRSDIKNVYGRPKIRVNVWYPNIDEYTHYDTIDDKPYGDLNPGDFMLVAKDDWIRVQGYDETNWSHRGIHRQTHMDVEMLAQMIKYGMTPYFLEGYYRHMDHDRGGLTAQQQFGDSQRNMNGYVNRDNWGFINSKVEMKGDIKILFM